MKLLSKVHFEILEESYLVILDIDNLNQEHMKSIINEIISEKDYFKYMNSKIIISTKLEKLLSYPFAYFNQEEKTDFSSICITNSERIIQHISYYDKSLPITFSEIVRTVNAINTIEVKGVLCPANWHPGEPVIDLNAWAKIEEELTSS